MLDGVQDTNAYFVPPCPITGPMVERDWNETGMYNEARIAGETKTTEHQLWRERSRELSTDLQ